MTKEREDLARKLAKSKLAGDGYKARMEAIQRRLDEIDMKEAAE